MMHPKRKRGILPCIKRYLYILPFAFAIVSFILTYPSTSQDSHEGNASEMQQLRDKTNKLRSEATALLNEATELRDEATALRDKRRKNEVMNLGDAAMELEAEAMKLEAEGS